MEMSVGLKVKYRRIGYAGLLKGLDRVYDTHGHANPDRPCEGRACGLQADVELTTGCID